MTCDVRFVPATKGAVSRNLSKYSQEKLQPNWADQKITAQISEKKVVNNAVNAERGRHSAGSRAWDKGGSGHTDLGTSVSCECHVTLSYISYFFSCCVSYLGNYTHWTRKYFTYCFKFYIFVLLFKMFFEMYFKNLLAFNFLIKSFSKSLLLRMQRYNTNTIHKES